MLILDNTYVFLEGTLLLRTMGDLGLIDAVCYRAGWQPFSRGMFGQTLQMKCYNQNWGAKTLHPYPPWTDSREAEPRVHPLSKQAKS